MFLLSRFSSSTVQNTQVSGQFGRVTTGYKRMIGHIARYSWQLGNVLTLVIRLYIHFRGIT